MTELKMVFLIKKNQTNNSIVRTFLLDLFFFASEAINITLLFLNWAQTLPCFSPRKINAKQNKAKPPPNPQLNLYHFFVLLIATTCFQEVPKFFWFLVV